MKVIALVGVSGSGKTSLTEKIEKTLGNRVKIVPESTKGEICTYANLPLVDHKLLTKQQLLKYDVARLEYQLRLEADTICKSTKEIIVFEKSAPIYLMYLLTLSSRSVDDDTVNYFVDEVKIHTKRYYEMLFHLPFNWNSRLHTLERNFTNKYLLNIQDSALTSIIEQLDVPSVKLSGNFGKRTLEVINSIGVVA